MQGFLWLITQMSLLLIAAAGVFFWLGWRWRGQLISLKKDHTSTTSATEPLARPIPCGEVTLNTATEAIHCHAINSPTAEELQRLNQQLEEAEHHHRNLGKDLLRVHDELKSARLESAKQQAEIATLKAKLAEQGRE